ncbi:MAG: hypothetical protein ABUL72_05250 [Armatimonadota bacterium]
MTTIGDVLMVFGGVAALGFGAWCLVMVMNLLFPAIASRATGLLQHKGGLHLGIGTLVGLPILLVAFIMLVSPMPLVKVLGIFTALGLLAVGGIGFSGMAKLCSQRVKGFGGSVNDYQSLTKGTFLLVGACLFPFFGWFVIAPLCLFACIGTGFSAFRRPLAPPVPMSDGQQ